MALMAQEEGNASSEESAFVTLTPRDVASSLA